MITGNIKAIKKRSNKNSNVIVLSSETTYADADNLGDVFEWVIEKKIITGDCLELDHKTSGDAYYFNIYVKDKGSYVLDKKQHLYVDFSMNLKGDIDYCINITSNQYNHKLKIRSRISKINSVLASSGSN
ncbi:hypothetical protein K3G39_20170 [Pontibacter sp. HSC-14F20]|uniref:hypothetical protein n=1 Tax=Pontibacter sp. HSC-14F20 TaxID=2864136 RepID=UPI001C739E07|nr:hypothetical protein [Pontibacter sp. HSC-14F20]MBX0335554.1 hypothetical protein [Pontibacter sp. HSC-14F20]